VKSNLPQLEGDRRRPRCFVALTQFTNGVDTYPTGGPIRRALDVPVAGDAGHRTQLEFAASPCHIDRPGVLENTRTGLTSSIGHPDVAAGESGRPY